ncbi:flagellar biosynthetic protein FliQ [Planktotalea arctica]
MTISFVPKLVIVLIAMAGLATFMMQQMVDYFATIFEQIRLLQ